MLLIYSKGFENSCNISQEETRRWWDKRHLFSSLGHPFIERVTEYVVLLSPFVRVVLPLSVSELMIEFLFFRTSVTLSHSFSFLYALSWPLSNLTEASESVRCMPVQCGLHKTKECSSRRGKRERKRDDSIRCGVAQAYHYSLGPFWIVPLCFLRRHRVAKNLPAVQLALNNRRIR